jgi:hypothetical protein
MKPELTRAWLRELLTYNPVTGWFVRRIPRSGHSVGERAGSLNQNGYRAIQIDGRIYLEHRLAWFYVYGYWPGLQIDHRNRITDDNRLCNLRAATRTQNTVNSSVRCTNRLGVKGVSLRCGHYVARLNRGNHMTHVGTFDTIEEAKAAHDARHRELYGKFSPVHNSPP